MRLGPLGPLAHRARVLLVLGRDRDGGAHDDPARHQWLVGPPAAHGGGGPLPIHQPSRLQVRSDHRIDARHRHPVTQAQPHAEAGTPVTELGKEERTRKAAVRDESPAPPSREGGLEPLDEGQGRGAEAAFGPTGRG
jgi:hypothetical protein